MQPIFGEAKDPNKYTFARDTYLIYKKATARGILTTATTIGLYNQLLTLYLLSFHHLADGKYLYKESKIFPSYLYINHLHYNTKPAMMVNMGAWRPIDPKLRIT